VCGPFLLLFSPFLCDVVLFSAFLLLTFCRGPFSSYFQVVFWSVSSFPYRVFIASLPTVFFGVSSFEFDWDRSGAPFGGFSTSSFLSFRLTRSCLVWRLLYRPYFFAICPFNHFPLHLAMIAIPFFGFAAFYLFPILFESFYSSCTCGCMFIDKLLYSFCGTTHLS